MEALTKVFMERDSFALDFPDTPLPGDTYTIGSTTWTWAPPRWTAVSAVQGPPGPPGPVETDEGVYQQA